MIQGQYQPVQLPLEVPDDNFVGLATMGNYEIDQDRPGYTLFGPHEPTVQITVGGQPIEFMADTGAEHSVVTQPIGPLSQRQATIVGAMENQTRHHLYCLDAI